jgi:hypothetical protein
MRIILAVVLAVALAGAASAKPADSDPVTLITAIYKTYETDLTSTASGSRLSSTRTTRKRLTAR